MAVAGDVVDALAGFLAGVGMGAQGGEEGIDVALVELVASLFSPRFGEVGTGSIEGLGDFEEMAFGVEDVDDLDGTGEVFIGEVPDPCGAVAEDDLTLGLVEAAALGLAQDAACEGRGVGVGVAAGGGLDGGAVGGGVRVAHGQAARVEGVAGPHGQELGLAGLGGAVGLSALAAFAFACMHRHAGAVEAEIEGAGLAGLGVDDMMLVLGGRASERFGAVLHLLGVDGESGQFAQQLAGLCEADPGRGQAGHA